MDNPDPVIGAIRWIHIIAGFTAFLSAPIALAVEKGGLVHRRVGLAYVIAMVISCLGAIPVALDRSSSFLLALAVFSLHLTVMGVTAPSRRPGWSAAKIVTASTTVLTLAAGAWLLRLALLGSGSIRILPLVFGVAAVGLAASGLAGLFARPDYRRNLSAHITGMTVSYIAATTAFSATNLDFLPLVVRWIWPSVLGTPLIFWMTARHLPAAPKA